MAYRNIAEIFEMIEKMDAGFVAAVANLSEAQENYRPVGDRWTIAELAEHVGIVNSGFLRLTHKLLKQAEADPKPAKADLELQPVTLTDGGEVKPGKWKAPEMVAPKGGARVADSIAKNRQTIDDIFALKARLDVVDLSDQQWTHPALGPLSLYQWLLLLAEHEERHRIQVEEVKASAGFPN